MIKRYEMIENTMGEEYVQRWGSRTHEIHLALRSKTWFAFDLDDTLHNFRAASAAALTGVLSKIHTDHGASTIEEMQNLYRAILKEKTASAFTDGRKSRDYRNERFETLMKQSNLSYDDTYLDDLADIYQTVLSKSLCLKYGALDLLNMLKALGKKVVVVTEGPEDAQVWTVQQLGIAEHVDYLATTNRFGVSKVDGLLRKLMDHLGVEADDMAFIGDSWSRDMIPAMDEGVYAVHYAEMEDTSLDKVPVRVNTLKELQLLVTGVENRHLGKERMNV